MRIAAVDLGSNSFHLLVVDARPDGTFVPLVREKEMLRLGDVVAEHGRITDDAADAAVEVLRRFRSLADGAGADEYVACATSALREAEDDSGLIDRLSLETGLPVRVISGREEARLIFGAVRASVLLDPAPAVCLDLGGGSLEVSVGDVGGLLWSTSLKLGVARLTAELVRRDPPSKGDLDRLHARVVEELGPVAAELADLRPRMLVGTSGTLCDLARMAVALREGTAPASVHQETVTRAELEAVRDQVVERATDQRRRLPGLDSRRADQAPAGVVVALAALDLFDLDAMTVGEWALREGMVLDAIGHHDPADWGDDPRVIRRASVLDLCRRCNWPEGHSGQVAKLACELFDCLLPEHRLSPVDRELLELGALLHDIGVHVSREGHHKHTAYLIEHGRLRGFSPEEVRVLTCLGRYHRNGEPKDSFPAFAALPEDRRDAVTVLVSLLRVADGLDCGSTAAVDSIDVELDDDEATLRVEGPGDIDLELWGARRKKGMLERMLGRTLHVVAADRPAVCHG